MGEPMTDLPTNWFCLGLCALATVAFLGWVFAMAISDRGRHGDRDQREAEHFDSLPNHDGGGNG